MKNKKGRKQEKNKRETKKEKVKKEEAQKRLKINKGRHRKMHKKMPFLGGKTGFFLAQRQGSKKTTKKTKTK